MILYMEHLLYYLFIFRPTQIDVPFLDARRKRLVSYRVLVIIGNSTCRSGMCMYFCTSNVDYINF